MAYNVSVKDIKELETMLFNLIYEGQSVDEKVFTDLDKRIKKISYAGLINIQWTAATRLQRPFKADSLLDLQASVNDLGQAELVKISGERAVREAAEKQRIAREAAERTAREAAEKQRIASEQAEKERIARENAAKAKKVSDARSDILLLTGFLSPLKSDKPVLQWIEPCYYPTISLEQARALLNLDAVPFGSYIIVYPDNKPLTFVVKLESNNSSTFVYEEPLNVQGNNLYGHHRILHDDLDNLAKSLARYRSKKMEQELTPLKPEAAKDLVMKQIGALNSVIKANQ